LQDPVEIVIEALAENEPAPALATSRSFAIVERSTRNRSAASAIVVSPRTSCIQIPYFSCGEPPSCRQAAIGTVTASKGRGVLSQLPPSDTQKSATDQGQAAAVSLAIRMDASMLYIRWRRHRNHVVSIRAESGIDPGSRQAFLPIRSGSGCAKCVQCCAAFDGR